MIFFNWIGTRDGWTSETILYTLIRTLFPELTIKRHFRPKYLEGLEIDIYIEEMKLGIEYQGIQHFKPVAHWGGKEALKQLKIRDERKKVLCNNLGIDLVFFNYNEDLSQDFVGNRLSDKS